MDTHEHKVPAHSAHRNNRKEKLAESTAYTVNHGVACVTTDLIGASWLGMWLADKKMNVGCGHKLGWWMLGEFTGDILAVLPAVATQRYAPAVMDGLQTVLEPAFGWFYKEGAMRSARKWIENTGIAKDSPEYKAAYTQRVDELYKHEVEHLPHAALWTAYATGITGGLMQLFPETHADSCIDHNHRHKSFGQNLKVALIGKMISGAILLTARGVAPESARRWDRWASDTIYYPVTKGVSNLFGVDEAAVNRVKEKHDALLAGPSAQIAAPTQTEKMMVEQSRAVTA